MFLDLGAPISNATNAGLEWLLVTYGDAFEAAANQLLWFLLLIEQGLRGTPPALLLALVFTLAWLGSRRLAVALAMAATLYLVGCLGLWDQAMQTIAIVLVAVLLATVIGVPLGILSARHRRVRLVLAPVLDLAQTIPSFVYLIPAAMLLGLGKVPALLATVIYATPPLVRLTDLGLRQIAPDISEAAQSLGAGSQNLLWRIQLPLALPSIMQGLNQTVMMALGMVVIASMIGARGIGETVLLGLQRNDSGAGLVGGLGIVALAILFDRLLQSFGGAPATRRTRA
jgi:glycine betaine/proline transport system permease protein